MNTEQLDRQIDEIEQALIRDDPELVNRFRLLDGRDARRDVIVFSLLITSMVLLGYGLSMHSGAAWLAGAAAVTASFVVDEYYERRLAADHRWPHHYDDPRDQRRRPAPVRSRR